MIKNNNIFKLLLLLLSFSLSLLSCPRASNNDSQQCDLNIPSTVSGPDPLLRYQYYIRNSQSSQLDLNFGSNLDQVKKGNEVSVMVVDSGIDIRHPDLIMNIDLSKNLNLFAEQTGFSNCNNDPAFHAQRTSSHGTQASGIIAARDNNSLGIRGIAPRSKLSGINYLAGPLTSTNFIRSVEHQTNAQIQISNNSYGPRDSTGILLGYSRLREDLLMDSFTNGHITNFVFATGNGGETTFRFLTTLANRATNRINILGDPNTRSPYICIRPNCIIAYNQLPSDKKGSIQQATLLDTDTSRRILNAYRYRPIQIIEPNLGYPIDRASLDGLASLPSVISVTSVDRNGIQSVFSETGPHIWISAFGEDLQTTTLNNGYSEDFTGTSAAAPVVSGVLALILEQNPLLKNRDARLILAESARKNHISDMAWITNGGHYYGSNRSGFHYNPKYGFGLVDVQAALNLAKNWTPISGKLLSYKTRLMNISETFAESNSNGATMTFTVTNSPITRIEFMRIKVRTTNANHGDLEVTLKSSSATKKIALLEPHYCARPDIEGVLVRELDLFFNCSLTQGSTVADLRATAESDEPWIFGNVAHLGENSNQTWTIQVADVNKSGIPPFIDDSYDDNGGIFDQAQIIFYGR